MPTLFDQMPDMNQPECIRVIVNGTPVAKGRGRIGKPIISKKTGQKFTPVYTPVETRHYEDRIRQAARCAIGDKEPVSGAVTVFVFIYLPIPKSMPKKYIAGAMDGLRRPETKPDIDNYVKSALDGINKIIIHDDNQVAELHAFKHYADQPRMEIEVHPL